MTTFFQFCRDYPRSSVVDEVFTVVANQVLKKNMVRHCYICLLIEFIHVVVVVISHYRLFSGFR